MVGSRPGRAVSSRSATGGSSVCSPAESWSVRRGPSGFRRSPRLRPARTSGSSCWARKVDWASSPRRPYVSARSPRSTTCTRCSCRRGTRHSKRPEIVQSGTPLSMLRLSTAEEAATQRTMAGSSRAAAVLHKGLALRGVDAGRCVLLVGVMGTTRLARQRWRSASRRRSPPRRGPCQPLAWAAVAARAVPHALLAQRLVGARLRHRHGRDRHDGPFSDDARPARASHPRCLRPGRGAGACGHPYKDAASQAIVANGGTISHQHGVGLDHRRYLADEKGELGIAAVSSVATCLDPDRRMNPGKLLS